MRRPAEVTGGASWKVLWRSEMTLFDAGLGELIGLVDGKTMAR